MKTTIQTFLISLGVVAIGFPLFFLLTTVVCDWICQHNHYYEDAAAMTIKLDD